MLGARQSCHICQIRHPPNMVARLIVPQPTKQHLLSVNSGKSIPSVDTKSINSWPVECTRRSR